MASSVEEILSLLWIYVKQNPSLSSPVDEKTIHFFGKMKESLLPRKIPQAAPLKVQTSPTKPASPQPKPPPPKIEAPVKEEKKEEPVPETTAPTPPKFDKLLPRAVSFTTVDTFQTRKTISANKAMPSLADGCLYQNPQVQHRLWSVFSFPAAAQEAQFLQSVLSAAQERLQCNISHFPCLDPTFLSNLTLSAHDADVVLFFIEPHNETSLKKLLESHPAFSATPLREMDPFLPLGSINGKALHLFLLTPSTSTNQEIKSRLWLALKKLAFSSGSV